MITDPYNREEAERLGSMNAEQVEQYLEQQRRSVVGTLYQDVNECSHKSPYFRGLKYRGTEECVNSLQYPPTYEQWRKMERDNPEEFKLLCSNSQYDTCPPEFELFRDRWIEEYAWNDTAILNALIQFKSNGWSRSYRRNMVAAVNTMLNGFIAKHELKSVPAKRLRAAVDEIIDWLCYCYSMHDECWHDILHTARTVRVVDINKVEPTPEAKSFFGKSTKKKRTLSPEGAMSRRLQGMINQLKKKGAIRSDLDKLGEQ